MTKKEKADYDREYRKKNKKRIAEYQRQYRIDNEERLREYGRKRYREKHPVKLNQDGQERHKRTKEELKIYRAEYRARNKEKIKASNARYYRKNKAKRDKYNQEYSRKHPEVKQNYKRRRRSLEKNLPTTLTEEEWQTILSQHFHRCHYCGKKSDHLHQEHKIPVSKGGGYTAQNIVPSCQSCNSSKKTRDYKQFVKDSNDRLQLDMFDD